MLGDGAGGHPEQDQRAGTSFRWGDSRHHRARALGQHLARPGLTPVPAVGRDRERLIAHHLAPDATGEAEAIATDPAQAGLIVVGRTEPAARGGNDKGGIGGYHRTAPSWLPSWLA
jgi:hypothetical protein